MAIVRSYPILGDLETWFEVLKSLGASKHRTRSQLAEETGTTYNTFCRVFRGQLLPMGIMVEDGTTWEGVRGRPTKTYGITAKGRAIISAIEGVEHKFGSWDTQQFYKGVAPREIYAPRTASPGNLSPASERELR